ncbi:LuxR C-terminal-related transcriptional regulator [Skermanella stibiiresistens]|uniref:LuxR C-terminal-related transcriptional regulator n=1 Tax=Skermanella stibiiresistens TaxID=913326 RepID=UPI000567C1DC|nr:response regulator transcription factor [Skermanella stibiiresistens]
MNSNRLKVLIVDDHALVLHGFALSVLELYPDAEVMEANSLDAALSIVRRTEGLSLVLFDLHLDAEDGLTGVRRMIEALNETPLIVISASDESADVIDSVRAGAKGYLLKSGSSALLEHAISLVLSGETYVPLPRNVLISAATAEPERPTNHMLDRLTDRQRDVFQLLLAGHSNKEIARALGVLEGTVKVHVRAIMQKLGVKNRTQVAVAAARAGCFPEEV